VKTLNPTLIFLFGQGWCNSTVNKMVVWGSTFYRFSPQEGSFTVNSNLNNIHLEKKFSYNIRRLFFFLDRAGVTAQVNEVAVWGSIFYSSLDQLVETIDFE
jgi:hypothetical protein